MDINNLLIWIVCVSCVSIMIYAVRSYAYGWTVVSSLILAVTALIHYFNSEVAGIVAGGLWAVLIVIPSTGFRKVNQLVAQQRFGVASRLAKFLSWLHPADGWREQPELLWALELGQRGQMADAIAILHRYQTAKTAIGRNAAINLYQMGGRWQELLAWLENEVPSEVWGQDSNIIIGYLRALGEIDDLNGLVLGLGRFEPSLEKFSDPVTRNLGRLFAFAFCGEKEQVARLLNGPLAVYPLNIRQFWLATAELSAGNQASARELLLSIHNTSDIRLSNAIGRRLSHQWIDPQTVLTQTSKEILARVITEIEHESRYSTRADFRKKLPIATFFLIGLNLFFFGLEVIFGGSTDTDTLYKLGALVPQEALAGEWWRLLAATFLHYGFLHLLMNMLGLYILGPFVEFALGVPRYLLAYLITGIGSMLVVALMSVAGYSKADFVVGASGCIMGMIGVIAAILLTGWRREKSRLASKNLRTILFMIGFQAMFDLSTPQISFVGHTSGVIIGFLVGMILEHRWQAKY